MVSRFHASSTIARDSGLESNQLDRIRSLVLTLTKPVQLKILSQQKLEQHSQSQSSTLASQSALLKSQARLKAGYVDFDDGVSELLSFITTTSASTSIDKLLSFIQKLLFERLSFRDSETRLLAFLVIDKFFAQSAKFRELTINQLQLIFELTMGVTSGNAASTQSERLASLPKPEAGAKQLYDESLAILTNWYRRFSSQSKLLELGFQFLLNSLGLKNQFLLQREKEAKIAQMKKENENLLQIQFLQCEKELKENFQSMQSCIQSIDGVLELLFPSAEELIQQNEDNLAQLNRIVHSGSEETSENGNGNDGSDSVEWEEDESDAAVNTAPNDSEHDEELVWKDNDNELSTEINDDNDNTDNAIITDTNPAHSIDIAFSANLAVLETDENHELFLSLRDYCNEIQKSWIPMLSEWRHTVSKIAVPSMPTNPADSDGVIRFRQYHRRYHTLKASIESLAKLMESKLLQCAQFNISIKPVKSLQAELNEEREREQQKMIDSKIDGGSSSAETGVNDFSSSLRQRRSLAEKRVTKRVGKRALAAKERASEKPSAIHKKCRGSDQTIDR